VKNAAARWSRSQCSAVAVGAACWCRVYGVEDSAATVVFTRTLAAPVNTTRCGRSAQSTVACCQSWVHTGNTFPWSYRSGDAGGTYQTGGRDHEAV